MNRHATDAQYFRHLMYGVAVRADINTNPVPIRKEIFVPYNNVSIQFYGVAKLRTYGRDSYCARRQASG